MYVFYGLFTDLTGPQGITFPHLNFEWTAESVTSIMVTSLLAQLDAYCRFLDTNFGKGDDLENARHSLIAEFMRILYGRNENSHLVSNDGSIGIMPAIMAHLTGETLERSAMFGTMHALSSGLSNLDGKESSTSLKSNHFLQGQVYQGLYGILSTLRVGQGSISLEEHFRLSQLEKKPKAKTLEKPVTSSRGKKNVQKVHDTKHVSGTNNRKSSQALRESGKLFFIRF